VEPGVDGRRTLECMETLQRLREEAERGREQLALEGGSFDVRARGQQELVGQAAAVGG